MRFNESEATWSFLNHYVEDVTTTNFLQYQQESMQKRESNSFVLPSQQNLVQEDQEFKVPLDLSF